MTKKTQSSMSKKLEQIEIALQKAALLEKITEVLANRINTIYYHIKNIQDGIPANKDEERKLND